MSEPPVAPPTQQERDELRDAIPDLMSAPIARMNAKAPKDEPDDS